MFDLIREAAPRNGMTRLFSDYLGESPWEGPRFVFPALDVYEDEKVVRLVADLPGFKLEDVDVSLLGKELTIRGERKAQDPEGATVHHRERHGGSFTRTVILAAPIDPEKVQASLEDGVLEVTLPKPEAATPKKISIRRASK